MAVDVGVGIIKFAGDLKGLRRDLKTANKASTDALGAMEKRVSKGYSNVIKGAAGIFTADALYSAVKIGVAAVKTFNDELVKLGNVDVKNIGEIKRAIEALPPELGKASELTKGYYAIVSAGIKDQERATETLIATAQATRALNDASVDNAAVIKVSTGLMANYPKEIKKASDALDLLFAIEKEGKTNVAELVPVMGELGAIASQAGLSVDELGGAMAQVTQFAGSTSQAATALKAVLTNTLKPTKAMKEALAAMGAETAQALIEQEGFSGALQKFEGYAKTANIRMVDLFGSQEAIVGISALQKDGYTQLTSKIEVMTNKTGRAQEAYDRWWKSFDKTTVAFESAKDKVWRSFGEEVLPLVQRGMEDFTRFTTENAGAMKGFFTGIADLAEAVVWVTGKYSEFFQVLGTGYGYFMQTSKIMAESSNKVRDLGKWYDSLGDSTEALAVDTEKHQEKLSSLRTELTATAKGIEFLTDAIEKEKASGSGNVVVLANMSKELENAKGRFETTAKAIADTTGRVTLLKKGNEDAETSFKNLAVPIDDLNFGLGDLTDGSKDVSVAVEDTDKVVSKFTQTTKKAAEEIKLTASEIETLIAGMDASKITGTLTYDIDYGGQMSLADQVAEDNKRLEEEFASQKKMAAQHVQDMMDAGEAFGEESYDVDFGVVEGQADALQREVDEMNKIQDEYTRKEEERYNKIKSYLENSFEAPLNTIMQGLRGDWSDLGDVGEEALNQLVDSTLAAMAEIAGSELAKIGTEWAVGYFTSHVGTGDVVGGDRMANVTDGQMILPEGISDWIRDAVPGTEMLSDLKDKASDYFGFETASQTNTTPPEWSDYGAYAGAVNNMYQAYENVKNGDYMAGGISAGYGVGAAVSTYGEQAGSQAAMNVGSGITSGAGALASGYGAYQSFQNDQVPQGVIQTAQAIQQGVEAYSALSSGSGTAAGGTAGTAPVGAGSTGGAAFGGAMAGAGGALAAWSALVALGGIEKGNSATTQLAVAGTGAVAGAIGGGAVGAVAGTVAGVFATGYHNTTENRFDLSDLDSWINQNRTISGGHIAELPRAGPGNWFAITSQQYYDHLNYQARAVNLFSDQMSTMLSGPESTQFNYILDQQLMARIGNIQSGGNYGRSHADQTVFGVGNYWMNETVDAIVGAVSVADFLDMDLKRSLTENALANKKSYIVDPVDPRGFLDAQNEAILADPIYGQWARNVEAAKLEHMLGGGAAKGGVATSGYEAKGYSMPAGDDFLLPVQSGEGIVRNSAMEGLNGFLETFGDGGEMLAVMKQIRDAVNNGKSVTVNLDAGNMMRKIADETFDRKKSRGVTDGRPSRFGN